MAIYNIPDFKIEELEKRITYISKKCEKYGNPFSYLKGLPFFKDINVDGKKATYRFYPVEVVGTAKIDNWEFVATLECHTNGNIIKRYNTGIELPERFKFSENICEHCFSNRIRTNLYIIHNIETGEHKQVGKSCLKSYTGGLSAEYVAYYMQIMDLLSEEDTTSYCNSFVSSKYYKVDEALSYALSVTNKYGYKKTLDNDGYVPDSTKNVVISILMDGIENTERHFGLQIPSEKEIFTEGKRQLVSSIIDYYVKLDGDTEFLHNIKVILAEKYCNIKNVGLLVYLPFGYKKAMENMDREKIRLENNSGFVYFGEIGKRYKDIETTLSVLTSYDSMYGMTYIYKLEDADNHIFVWKTSNFFETGNYMVTMSIKDHKEYRGQKQTDVTRCKLREIQVA